MERETKFVQVILPLALKGDFTYRVPFEWNDLIIRGQRVIVPLGKKKLYTGIISGVHSQAPVDFQAKYLEFLLDETPVVTAEQIQLWKWISEYYMCSLGEVMSAALPSSLKLASETVVVLASDERPDYTGLDTKESLVIEALEARGKISVSDVSEILEIKTVMPVLNRLIKKKIILSIEELSEKVKPKHVSLVEFTEYSKNEESRHEILDALQSRAFKQLELFLAFMRMKEQSQEVLKKDLLNYSGLSDGILKALREKNILKVTSKEISRIPQSSGSDEVSELSESQKVALQSIQNEFKTHSTCLLHGVTSSGKTEVYSELIEENIQKGKSVLFLVPEIALTTQLIVRLQRRFGDKVGVFHSKFNNGEKTEVWNEALKGKEGRFRIFIGARSAMFLPLNDLGFIIVDEEHDSSFKQFDPSPRYNARDMALVLAKLHNAKTLLGSATPALETYYNAKNGKFGLVEMHERFGNAKLPDIRTVDLREELKNNSMKEEFSSELIDDIGKTLKNGEQVILFQNRRGYSPVWQCVTCGNIPQCVKCDVSLTYHKPIHALKCHYCGYQVSPAPSECEVCSSKTYKMVGFGTQKIEEHLEELFPDIQVNRMDFDTTRSKNSYLSIIEDFQSGYTDVLIGTQMVSKGLDFENVGLVGVLQADHMLKFPDFRAYERSFQLMTQVAGRAGRREKEGRVLIQSYFPTHRIIQNVISHDYSTFFSNELEEREKYHYPPYSRLIKITLRHKKIEEVNSLAKELAYELKKPFGQMVLGPEFPPVIRIQNMYLKNILLKFPRKLSPKAVKTELNGVLELFKSINAKRAVRIRIDVDPS